MTFFLFFKIAIQDSQYITLEHGNTSKSTQTAGTRAEKLFESVGVIEGSKSPPQDCLALGCPLGLARRSAVGRTVRGCSTVVAPIAHGHAVPAPLRSRGGSTSARPAGGSG